MSARGARAAAGRGAGNRHFEHRGAFCLSTLRFARKTEKDAGFVEGQSVAIEYRWANHEYLTRLPELAADLVRRRVAVIVAMASAPAALAAKAATTPIRIVFGFGVDPVAAGLVDSINRPSGNITGITSMSGELGGKQLELLHDLLPNATRFAVLLDPKNPATASLGRDAQAAASATGRHVEVLNASTIAEIDGVFAHLVENRVQGLLVTTDTLFADRRIQLIILSARHAIPAIYPFRENAEAGGLMSYGPNLADRDRQVGIYVGRILKGEKPSALPVMRATKFEFVINKQTAKTMGLVIPPTFFALADEVIE